jgi:hypothetical protein
VAQNFCLEIETTSANSAGAEYKQNEYSKDELYGRQIRHCAAQNSELSEYAYSFP